MTGRDRVPMHRRGCADAWPRAAAGRTGRGGRAAGSATVELVVIVPFVLVVLAAVWDLREYIGYRTELIREAYVVAEAIADDPDGSPVDGAIEQAVRWLEPPASSEGMVRVAVVVRGVQDDNGAPCPDDGWCLPRVTRAWPAPGDEARFAWSGDDENDCAGDSLLPAAGEHFAAAQKVLPAEDADSPDQEDWISRNMRESEWWVVVDICVVPRPGLFLRAFTNMADWMLDTSFALRRRAVWGSIHDIDDCDWCGP